MQTSYAANRIKYHIYDAKTDELVNVVWATGEESERIDELSDRTPEGHFCASEIGMGDRTVWAILG